jgi:hypothetical protein
MTTHDFNLDVVAALNEAGVTTFYEYPGIVSIHLGNLVLSTGLCGWDYGTWSRVLDDDLVVPDETDAVTIDLPMDPEPEDFDRTVATLVTLVKELIG